MLGVRRTGAGVPELTSSCDARLEGSMRAWQRTPADLSWSSRFALTCTSPESAVEQAISPAIQHNAICVPI